MTGGVRAARMCAWHGRRLSWSLRVTQDGLWCRVRDAGAGVWCGGFFLERMPGFGGAD